MTTEHGAVGAQATCDGVVASAAFKHIGSRAAAQGVSALAASDAVCNGCVASGRCNAVAHSRQIQAANLDQINDAVFVQVAAGGGLNQTAEAITELQPFDVRQGVSALGRADHCE